jgi:hypothetical protein
MRCWYALIAIKGRSSQGRKSQSTVPVKVKVIHLVLTAKQAIITGGFAIFPSARSTMEICSVFRIKMN